MGYCKNLGLYVENKDAIIEALVESFIMKHDDQEMSKTTKIKGRKKIKKAKNSY